MASKKKSDYGADSIVVLEGLEPVRKRPAMYIGTTAQYGVNHCLNEIIDNSIGIYTTNRICSSGSTISGYSYDTTFNVPLVVQKEDDSTLLINGIKLSFEGNLDTKYYHFFQPASGGGHYALIDSN